MFARLNFLLATALAIAALLYLVGRFVVVAFVGWINPRWTGYAAGAWLLISLMLVVSCLARIQARLEKVPASLREPTGAPGIAGQVLLCAGHVVLGVAAYRWLEREAPVGLPGILAPALIYALGIAAVLIDMRRRTG
ncbi:MAG TPA: hypothetical protein VNM24_01060 [Burkholderiales bacterium]|jgi:hypothetical protein|nr:hypothetical protein [Burkholderiales bacterium]